MKHSFQGCCFYIDSNPTLISIQPKVFQWGRKKKFKKKNQKSMPQIYHYSSLKMKSETFLKGSCIVPHPHHKSLLNSRAFFQFPYGRVCSCLKKTQTMKILDSDANIKAPKNKPAIVTCETGWVMKTSIQLNYPGSVKNFFVIWWTTIK